MADLKLDATSRDWEAMEPYWTMATDLLEGADAVRLAGEKYLPRLPGEEPGAYEYRRKTAKYVNVFADIVTNLAAKPFRKEVAVKDASASPAIMALAEDIDARGHNLHVFAADTFFNGIAYAVDWILVDYSKAKPRADERPLTVAEEREQGLRPYWVRIPAQNMLAVESASVDGREQFVHARILEEQTIREGFQERLVTRVRVFDRTLNGDGSYGPPIWQLYEQVPDRRNGGKTWELIESGVLTIGEIPLVPFVAGRRKGSSWQFTPPMQDCAHLQVEHYQQEASLKAIKELTAFPMLAGVGVQPEMRGGSPAPVLVGPRAVLYAPPTGDGKAGEWKFIEPQGHSLNFLAASIEATEKQLRELGRQPLTAQTGNLTVVTTAFAASKANSVISAWALNLKDALEQALRFTALWLNDASQPEVEIADDFDAGLNDDKEPAALLEMRKEGDLSRESLWAEMKRRGVLSPEFDPAVEVQRLEDEMPDPDSDDELSAAIVPFRPAGGRIEGSFP